MLRLGILGLGVVAALVIVDCGGRTPVEDAELFGIAGSTVSTGSSGTNATGPGGTVIVGTGGSVTVGVGGSTIGTGVGGFGTGAGGSTTGNAGSIIVGTGGSTGASGSIGAGGSVIGTGGFAGSGGSSVGTGGSTGTGGAGGVPGLVRQLVQTLPGTRPNADCVGCATRCPGSVQCATNPACAQGLACAVANCGMQNMGGACLAMCLGNNPQTFTQVVAALQCVYGTCDRQCVVGRMR